MIVQAGHSLTLSWTAMLHTTLFPLGGSADCAHLEIALLFIIIILYSLATLLWKKLSTGVVVRPMVTIVLLLTC